MNETTNAFERIVYRLTENGPVTRTCDADLAILRTALQEAQCDKARVHELEALVARTPSETAFRELARGADAWQARAEALEGALRDAERGVPFATVEEVDAALAARAPAASRERSGE